MAEIEEKLKSLLMKVKEENEKVALKLNIQKSKITASGPIISWQIDGEIVETVRLATPLPAPAIIGRREAGSSKLHPGKCSPMFSPGGRSSEETRPVHPVWAMSPQRLRPPLPFGWTDRTPQRVTSFIGTCTVLWPCSREPCLAALVASVCCQVRTRTLHRGCAGPRARDGDDQAGC